MQQRLIALYESRFADEIDDFGHNAVPFEATPANNEENTGEKSSRDQIQDDQDRSCHSANDGEAHEEMRHALLDYAFGNNLLLADLAAAVCLDNFEYTFVVGHAVSVHRSLRYQSIWQGNVNYSSNEACTSEQEEIPMEATWFLERELLCLRSDTALILLI